MFVRTGYFGYLKLAANNLHLGFVKMTASIIETKCKSQTGGGCKKFKWQAFLLLSDSYY